MRNLPRIGVVGATGYVGVELVRLLSGHPGLTLSKLVSHTYVAQRMSDVYPAFSKIVDLPLEELNPDQLAESCDLVITALPHGVSATVVPELLSRGLRVLDHSGDFRYRDVDSYEKVYQRSHPCPELLKEAVYGLPELYRDEIQKARLVANPGCYPTCSLLALMPLLKNRLIKKEGIIIDAVSGISGAGRKSDVAYSFCETQESLKAYGVVGHRHTSEIEQECGRLAGLSEPLPVTFTPHLAPLKRGMLATVYTDLMPDRDPSELQSTYQQAYQNEWFIRLLPSGTSPDTRQVACSNFADIAVFYDEKTHKVKTLCALDNLGKGAASQAIQTINLMFGLKENCGLCLPGQPL